MTTLKDKIIEAGFVDHILTDVDLNGLLDGTPAARYGMVNKALKKGELIKIRRGLYIIADKYRYKKLSKFFLASRIAPHSYISLESAMSSYGWIPERVATVTSVLARHRTKKFMTPFGEFVFYQLPINEYEFLTGVTRVEEIKGEPFLIASPLRALIDREQLMKINRNHFFEIKKVYRSKRVLHFLDRLKQELKK